MAQSVIGALRVNLGLDSAQFEKGTKRARSAQDRFAKEAKRVGIAVTTAFAAIGAAAIAGGRDIDAAAKAARRVGASIGGFEALKLAADEAGVPVSALPNELQNINRELANIGTSGNADRALERLGISAADIADLDADERIARIADRVQELGLSSGEATAVLRDLGVRNREMVLLLQQGGDAIRNARRDVEDYGLALSGPTAAAIESANDQIGRLSIVSRVFGQQLAQSVVPALGRFSEQITESVREGGLLRGVIDQIARTVNGFVVIISGAISGMQSLVEVIGVRTVGAVAALSAALLILRRRMILTGIGALIVGAGTLVDFFDRLKDATGSWGEALSALGDVAAGVWEGIKTSAQSIPMALSAVWSTVRANFFALIGDMAGAWSDFISGITNAFTDEVESFNPITGERKTYDSPFKDFFKDAGDGAETLSGKMRDLAEAEGVAADAMGALARTQVTAGMDKAREALARLTEIMNTGTEATDAAATEAQRLKDALDEMGDGAGGGGGGAAGRAADALNEAGSAVDDFGDRSDRTADRFGDMVANIVTGSQSIGDALKSIGSQLISSGISGIASSLFKGSGLGSLIGSIAGGFDSGGFIPSGKVGAVAGFGDELMNGGTIVRGPARVTSRADTARMMGGGEQVGGTTTIRLIAPEGFTAQQEGQARGIAVQVVQEASPGIVRRSVGATYERAKEVAIP